MHEKSNAGGRRCLGGGVVGRTQVAPRADG